MENEKAKAAQATNRDLPHSVPDIKQDCADVVNISIFFDGTGNNKAADEKEKKWSNPARLWLAAFNNPNIYSNNYPIYISGVGTTFNGTATDWLDKTSILAEDNIAGNVGGGGGTRRVELGQSNINSALRNALLNNAKKLNIAVEKYAVNGEAKGLTEISQALRSHRLIKVINLSIFGFSRGAALARVFSNEILKECEIDSEKHLTYHGIRLRIHFLGLFDTVASFGVPSANMDGFFREKNLTVPAQVERCVHYIAAHELRFSFPVDLIRQHGKLAPGWVEEVFPGVHSDVGGGYEPTAQKLSNNYARIPMRSMMSEAVVSGVRMLGYDDMRRFSNTIFTERFAVLPETQKNFDHYMSAVAASGTIEAKVATHMKALYAAYGTMSRRGIVTPDLVAAEGSTGHKLIGHVGIAREAAALLHASSGLKLMGEQARRSVVEPLAAIPQAIQFSGTVYSLIVRPETWRLHAWNQTASDAVLNFIKNSVHDSKAGFIMSVEPFSYFRPRGMAESSRSVLAKGLEWYDDSLKAIKKGVIRIYHQAEEVVVETWQEGKLIARKTYRVGEKFAVDTVQAGQKYAVEVYQSGKDVVITTMDAGQRMIVSSIDTVQKKASSMLDSAQKSASEMAQQAGKGARQLSDTIGETVDDGMKTIEHGWMSTKAALGL